MSQNNKPDQIVYQVVTVNDKSYWNRVGVAWSNSKGGFSIKMNSMPLEGDIVMMPPNDNPEEQQ